HPWSSTIEKLDNPDYLIIDLDPHEISFNKVIECAKVTQELLEKLKIPSFPKTSGLYGMHIYIPLGAKYSYDTARQFCEILVNLIHKKLPKTTSVVRDPDKRKGKIYLDYLQNRRGQTIVAPYS